MVIDSIMGSGKSSYAIQEMNNQDECKKYIYITPYLDEVKRVKNNVTKRKFYEPNEKLGHGRKINHFKKLISEGKNIVSTHALFSYIDLETELLLKDNEYILILDEVFKVVENLEISKSDILMIKDHITIDENGKVTWNTKDYEGRFIDIKNCCDNESLYSYGGEFFFWTFPARIFELFTESYVLTYLFSCQIQAYYYRMFDIEFEYKSVKYNEKNKQYELCEYDAKNEDRSKLKELINIYYGKMNTNYFIRASSWNNELSTNWFKNADPSQINQLRKNLINWFNNINKTKSKENLWTTKKSVSQKLKGKSYTKSFIPMNTRATNEYKSTKYLAYVYNRFLNPIESNFFKSYGIKVDEDLLAVSDLLQWIWRSQIRDGKDIELYIPSKRMRDLLVKYLNYEI